MSIIEEIVKKLVTSVACLALVVVINFLLPRFMPGDPVLMLTGQNDEGISELQYEAFKEKLGVDDPLHEQFFRYISDIFSGNLGYSYHHNSSVMDLLKARIPNTLSLALPAILLSSMLAVLLGCNMGYRAATRLESVVTSGFITINAIPAFLLAMILVTVFSFKLRLFPLSGISSIVLPSNTIFRAFDRVWHLTLPIICITIASLPDKYLLVRNAVALATEEKYVIYAKARGLSQKRIKFIHIFKNVCQPFITVVGLNLGFIISGSMITEIVFSINGMGALIYDAVTFRDFPTLQGCLFVIAVMVILANIITDIACIVIDPRQRVKWGDSIHV